MGCGTCTLTNRLIPYSDYIRAVDNQVNLLNYCLVNEKLETVTADITDYKDDRTYDVILLFGVLNYVKSDATVKKIYNNCFDMLKEGGILIVKQQSGVFEDKEVNKYSKELEADYYALYRNVGKEISLLEEQSFQVNTIDIYPDHMNPWNETHHYAYIGRKNL